MTDTNVTVHRVRDDFAEDRLKQHIVYEAHGLFIYGKEDAYALADRLEKRARRVRDWASSKTAESIRQELIAAGYVSELRYDAAHGRRYQMVAYHMGPSERRICLAAQSGMRSTNPELSE